MCKNDNYIDQCIKLFLPLLYKSSESIVGDSHVSCNLKMSEPSDSQPIQGVPYPTVSEPVETVSSEEQVVETPSVDDEDAQKHLQQMSTSSIEEENAHKRRQQMLYGNVWWVCTKKTLGMLFGRLAMIMFNFIDTLFVSMIPGTTSIAAISFTFPIVLVMASVGSGLSASVTIRVSELLGGNHHRDAARTVTESITLMVIVSIILSILGAAVSRPLLYIFGARDDILDEAVQYMLVWWLGFALVIVPMVLNGAIRATGDMIIPSVIMLVAVIVNITLDPILIFGPGPLPGLGIVGAALATLISRSVTLVASLAIVTLRYHLFNPMLIRLKSIITTLIDMVKIGLPCVISNLSYPLMSLAVTVALGHYMTAEDVAGYGVATRYESIAMSVPMSAVAVIMPLVGQNMAAGRVDRVASGLAFLTISMFTFCVIVWLTVTEAAPQLIRLFKTDPAVVDSGVAYLRGGMLGFPFLCSISLLVTALVGLGHRALSATLPIINTVLQVIALVGVIAATGSVGWAFVAYSGPPVVMMCLVLAITMLCLAQAARMAAKRPKGGEMA